MKKGFTLLELVVVIIILGVIATLGFTQYGRMVERARGAEARPILGDMRKLAYAYRLANGTIAGITLANLNIGTAEDQIPGPTNCRSTHWFKYSRTVVGDPVIRLIATRCYGSLGKPPNGVAGMDLTLQTNLVTGEDVWTGEY